MDSDDDDQPLSSPTRDRNERRNESSSGRTRMREPAAVGLSGSPTRSGRKYGDRYIPSRAGVNLQAAFSLVPDRRHPVNQESDSRVRRRNSSNFNEAEYMRVEEANQTFSTLLKAEIFGDKVPQAAPSLSSADMHENMIHHENMDDSRHSRDSRHSSGSGRTTPPLSSSSATTPPTIRSAPVTPSKNLFKFSGGVMGAGPSGSSSHSLGGLGNTPRGTPRGTPVSSSDVFSISPVRTDSQHLLLSPRKRMRAISKTPFKVLDAPELEDDFYLNLLDWGSQNVLGVGLGSCVYLWNGANAAVEKLCELPYDDKVTSLSWIQVGTHLAVGTDSGTVEIWDVEQSKKVRTMTGHSQRVGSLAWKDHILTSGSRDYSILHRDVRIADHYIHRLRGHKQEVCGLKWNAEENQLASGGNDNKMIIWDGLNTEPLYKLSHDAAVKAIAWSPHQRGLLASGGGTADRQIRFWNTHVGECVSHVVTGSQVCNLAWSKNSNELVSTHGFSQNEIVIWKYPAMRQVASLTGHLYRVLYLAMSPDGKTIVTGAGDETLRFWEIFKENTMSRDSSLLDVFQQLR